MVIKSFFTRAALWGVVLVLTMTGCPSPCPEVVHNFAITAEFSPEKDSIRVGDTLYLSSSFAANLKDVSSGKEVNHSNAVKVGSNVHIQELPVDKSAIKGGVGNFTFFALKGGIYNDVTVPRPEGVNQLTYRQSGPNYELLIGFIPQKKGVFCLASGDGFSMGRLNTDCDKASFSVRLVNANQHLYYLENYLGVPPSPYSVQKAYCFKVY